MVKTNEEPEEMTLWVYVLVVQPWGPEFKSTAGACVHDPGAPTKWSEVGTAEMLRTLRSTGRGSCSFEQPRNPVRTDPEAVL